MPGNALGYHRGIDTTHKNRVAVLIHCLVGHRAHRVGFQPERHRFVCVPGGRRYLRIYAAVFGYFLPGSIKDLCSHFHAGAGQVAYNVFALAVYGTIVGLAVRAGNLDGIAAIFHAAVCAEKLAQMAFHARCAGRNAQRTANEMKAPVGRRAQVPAARIQSQHT